MPYITYQEVWIKITSALTGRIWGTKVQVVAHESAEKALLDYIEQLKSETSGSIIRGAHAAATAGINCELLWDMDFGESEYDYSVNGFDRRGNPVQVILVSKTSSKLVIKTLVDATMTALAKPYTT